MFQLAPATSQFGFQFHPLQFHHFPSKRRRPKLQSLYRPFPKILLKKISCPLNEESTAKATADHQSRVADHEPDETTTRQAFQAHLQACGEHQPSFAKPPSAKHHLNLDIRTVDLSGGKLEFEPGNHNLIICTRFDYIYRPQFWPRASFQDYSILSIYIQHR